MAVKKEWVAPEHVLGAIYGRTSRQLGMSEKRRDEIIAAAIYTSFRNQEFGTRFRLPRHYHQIRHLEDASGIDVIVSSPSGRKKKLQIKGIHIQRSIERRKRHKTKGGPRILGRKSRWLVERDSAELTKIMKGELKKIIQDYSGLILIIHVVADLATQTSLEIAIRKSQSIVENLKAKEVWFLRNVPVRAIYGKSSPSNCYSYQLLKITPDKRTYGFSFAL